MKSQAFLSALFADYHRDLKRFITRKFGAYDAEDIVQDAFHNMLRCDEPEALENPKAYLFQAANNLALNRLRKQGRHENYVATLDPSASTAPLEASAEAQSDLEHIEKVIHKLPKRCREVFYMSRINGKSYAEIAAALDISVSTVEKDIAKSLLFLRDYLG